jgi:AcrB/AcrD/AcrF family
LPPLIRILCPTDTAAVADEAAGAITALNLPGDVPVAVGGESEDIEEGFQNLFLSLIVALALAYVILVIFFGSLLVPLVILLAVPLRPSGPSGSLPDGQGLEPPIPARPPAPHRHRRIERHPTRRFRDEGKRRLR